MPDEKPKMKPKIKFMRTARIKTIAKHLADSMTQLDPALLQILSVTMLASLDFPANRHRFRFTS